MAERFRQAIWRTYSAAGCRWLLVLGILVWGVGELSRYAEWGVADELAVQPAPAQPKPWQGASFPVENFAAYTSPFGYRQHPYGGYRFHYGLDVAAPLGSYIRSWWDGTIIEVSDDTACGTSAIVKSGDWLHIYCHMQGHIVWEVDGDRVLVDRQGGIEIQQGAKVRAGQQIGRVGMTGSTTGPHLHWGLKYKGTWIDPARVLQAMITEQSSP
ncbi:M23 family metallopeptidase [Pseudanabaena sp. FACHB-2040]|uniref:M23 family metallopeptidase n=1 Tax=Pseudanabaena sp. FACHB-2040 TaxID=2692859 RepID=UPI001687B816|nr:M23 family metallopeptidase [Pseudanabaena sp. FACHB-2040]MBD2258516.1 M23 family metallopeptidase [Pseudanabaena sp. FACHB-2040]